MLRKSIIALALVLLPVFVMAWPSDCNWEDTIVVRDHDIHDGSNGGPVNLTYTMTSNNLYVLVGHVYVENTCELTIEPGTVIWGTLPLNADYAPDTTNPGAIIVAQGGKIHACGTRCDPIIMTAVYDSPCDNLDFTKDDLGLWGGLIILGNAQINTDAGVGNIEGIDQNPLSAYGGENDNDNSGELCYVSVRHGGYEIGTANEINGITYGGVGDGTVLSHVEVIANLDDGMEWFGGNVNGDHLAAIFVGDDGFDHDEGYRGTYQYMYIQYSPTSGDKNGEHDGGTDPESGTPYTHPIYYNATYVGRGAAEDCATAGGKTSTFHIRDNWGGEYRNSIFTEATCFGIYEIEDRDDGTDPSEVDSEQRLRLGDLTFANNMWYNPNWTTMVDYVRNAGTETHVVDYFNDVSPYDHGDGPTNEFGTDPQVLDPLPADGSLNPMLNPASPAVGGAMSAYPAELDDVNYKGAFAPYDASAPATYLDNWLLCWSFLYEHEYLENIDNILTITCGDGNGDGNVNLLDITFMINFLYKDGPDPVGHILVADVNGDGNANLLDITYMINYLYKDGSVPACTWQTIGELYCGSCQ